jgi:hypothetical protein
MLNLANLDGADEDPALLLSTNHEQRAIIFIAHSPNFQVFPAILPETVSISSGCIFVSRR